MNIPIKDIREETNIAINKSGNNANPEWKREAQAALAILIRKGDSFTADDIWRLLEHTGLKTQNNSALGAIFQQAHKDGLIHPTGAYTLSLRRERHRAPLRVWHSSRIKKFMGK